MSLVCIYPKRRKTNIESNPNETIKYLNLFDDLFDEAFHNKEIIVVFRIVIDV